MLFPATPLERERTPLPTSLEAITPITGSPPPLAACLSHYVTETFHLYSFKRLLETLFCLGLRRIVTAVFLRRVQIFLLTYLLTYFGRHSVVDGQQQVRSLPWPQISPSKIQSTLHWSIIYVFSRFYKNSPITFLFVLFANRQTDNMGQSRIMSAGGGDILSLLKNTQRFTTALSVI